MKRNYTVDQLRHMVKISEWAERAIEIIPPIATAVMVIHDLLLCFDIRLPHAEAIVIAFAVILMLLFSYSLGFCTLHRSFILYNWAMLICIHWQRFYGFGSYVHALHWLMLALGIFLIIKLIQRKCKEKSLLRHS